MPLVVYDHWERLVVAVLDREKLRELARSPSLSSSFSDSSSRISFDSTLQDGYASSDSRFQSYRDVRPIAFKAIKKATKNFQSDLFLGEGAFGRVYKGWIHELTLRAAKPGSGIAVAVKKWKPNSILGREAWLKELNYMNQLRHPNLVKLIGYCSEGDQPSLVYEYMPNGSLDNRLFRRGNEPLPWNTRIKVAIDVARALSFLHDMEKQVIHHLVNVHSVLLDGEFNAKLCGFGFAMDGPTGEMTHVTTEVIVTSNITSPPEYITTGHLTAKCDVFRFGVVLLEILSGRRGVHSTKIEEQNLVDWAKTCMNDDEKFLRLIDTNLDGQYPRIEAYTFLTIASQCLRTNPELRPRMAEVLNALQQLYDQKTIQVRD